MWYQVPRRGPAGPASDPADAARPPGSSDDLDKPASDQADADKELGIGRETKASFGVAGWTLISRFSGLLRVAVAGAILGPTFFANIFQATNTVPNLTYNLMAGSLLTELMIPIIVAELDHRGVDETRKLVRQLVGVVLVGFAAAGGRGGRGVAADRAPADARCSRSRRVGARAHPVLGAALPRAPADRALRDRGGRDRRPERARPLRARRGRPRDREPRAHHDTPVGLPLVRPGHQQRLDRISPVSRDRRDPRRGAPRGNAVLRRGAAAGSRSGRRSGGGARPSARSPGAWFPPPAPRRSRPVGSSS